MAGGFDCFCLLAREEQNCVQGYSWYDKKVAVVLVTGFQKHGMCVNGFEVWPWITHRKKWSNPSQMQTKKIPDGDVLGWQEKEEQYYKVNRGFTGVSLEQSPWKWWRCSYGACESTQKLAAARSSRLLSLLLLWRSQGLGLLLRIPR